MKFKIVLTLSFLVVLFFLWKALSSPVNPDDTQLRGFVITKGQSVIQISQKLKKEGLIKNVYLFRFYTQFTRNDKKIQAGEYLLSPSMSLQQIILALISGPREIWITYPEGLRREEIAARTIKALELEKSVSSEFWEAFMTASEDEEGLLFPDTYLFPKDVKAEIVAKKLRSTFDTKISGQLSQDIKKSSLTAQEVITLASIVERETNTKEERPIVAGILLKRLGAGWPLQVDATLQYFTATRRCGGDKDCEWWKPPTVKDKSVKSAYNTYTNIGLPPGPIANPSLSSIEAVAYPKSSSYWFYLHGSDGKIHYAETIEEHNQNIRKYIQ